MNKDELLVELNIRISDTDNFTFTPEEKAAAIRRAINDDYTVGQVYDDSLTYSTSTYSYAVPTGVTVVTDILYSPDNGTSRPITIDANLWTINDGNIQVSNGIPDGYTMYVKGNYRYTEDDTINDTTVQEYVLANATLILYSTLLAKRNFRFLKNDTSVAEIVTSKNAIEREVQRYRQMLPKAYQAG